MGRGGLQSKSNTTTGRILRKNVDLPIDELCADFENNENDCAIRDRHRVARPHSASRRPFLAGTSSGKKKTFAKCVGGWAPTPAWIWICRMETLQDSPPFSWSGDCHRMQTPLRITSGIRHATIRTREND